MLSSAQLKSKFTRGAAVLREQAQRYLRTSTGFLEVLFILMHLTYGSSARMTEINTWKTVNSVHSPRNIYCHSRGLILLGLYNKTTSLTGMERFIIPNNLEVKTDLPLTSPIFNIIIHLIPARLEKLFLKYLIYIRPFEK
ncbi:hypothetical protein V1524DRAFT_404134 [Lipomyces starkeyi]